MDPTSLLETTTLSVGESSAELAKPKRAKSPPLAFEKTPNDALVPLVSPPQAGTEGASPTMGRLSPLRAGEEADLQVVIDQQAAAIDLLHHAFAAERQAWSMEKERLYLRIASLEKLLKMGDGYSPAKSPVLSPLNTSNFASPQARSTTHRLPSIAEDEPIPSLSQRRENAPSSIDLPTVQEPSTSKSQLDGTVSFGNTPGAIITQEILVSPPEDRALSPPPFHNRMEAGHTPLRAPRPLTPPPQNSLITDAIEDTPTRNNTHINAYLTRSNDEEEDRELRGPLNMPELPNAPDESNFTLEALSKRLERIERDPEGREGKPMVFAEPSPGLASPAGEMASTDDVAKTDGEPPLAPTTTKNHPSDHQPDTPSFSSAIQSPPSAAALSPLSKHTSRDNQESTSGEEKVQADFEHGGIRLKKKPSTNFGAPWGSLSGFGAGSGRRVSRDVS